MEKKKKNKFIYKIVGTLELISRNKEGLKLNQISSILGLNISTAHNIVSELIDVDLLSKENKKYYLGPKLLNISSNYEKHNPKYEKFIPFLEEMSKKFKENLCVIACEEPNPIMFDRFDGSHIIKPSIFYPSKHEAHASGWGKLWLSTLSKEKLLEHIANYNLTKFTNNTVTDLNNLLIELEKIKKQGFAIDNEERYDGLCCLAVKLPSSLIRTKNILIAVFEIPKQRFKSDLIDEMVKAFKKLTDLANNL